MTDAYIIGQLLLRIGLPLLMLIIFTSVLILVDERGK